MNKTGKILWVIIVSLVVIGCATLVFLKTNQPQPTATEKTTTNKTKPTPKSKAKSSTSSKSQSQSSSSSTSSDNKAAASTSDSDQSSQGNVYYQGQRKMVLPTTDGVANDITFWPATMTINGVRQSVIASYHLHGDFSVYTKQPAAQNYSFNYGGLDYEKYIGTPNLDDIPKNSSYD